jgi:hypothetical protein
MGLRAVRKFISASEKIRAAFPQMSTASGLQERFAAAYLFIDLNDLWSNFCRSLIIDIATGNAVDAAENVVVPTGGKISYQVALASVVNRQGHEPRWHNATHASQAAERLHSPLTPQIKLSLGVLNSPAPSLNITRNFFAHRRSECRAALQSASFYNKAMGFNAVSIGRFVRPSGLNLIDIWIDDLQTIAAQCVQ